MPLFKFIIKKIISIYKLMGNIESNNNHNINEQEYREFLKYKQSQQQRPHQQRPQQQRQQQSPQKSPLNLNDRENILVVDYSFPQSTDEDDHLLYHIV